MSPAYTKTTNGMHMYNSFDDKQHEAIIFALKLADRLMGEPSDEMMAEGLKNLVNNCVSSLELYQIRAEVFKAMRDQMIREVEE